MEKKRPQLELDELRQLKWLLGGMLALSAITSLLYLEIEASVFLVLGAILVPTFLIRPDWSARIPALVHKLVFPGVVAFTTYDVYAHNEVLASLVRLDVLLLLYRACHYRRRRDDLQLIVLGLFLVVMAGVITVSLAFALQIIVFVGCALLLMFVVTLVDAQEGGNAEGPLALSVVPAWARRSHAVLLRRLRETCDWRVFALGGGLFVGFVVLSGVLFMAIPRFQLDSGFAFDRLLSKKSTTGFSDVMKFGDVTDIQQDDSVALRVEASNRAQVPAVLYWRLVILDEYRSGTFRMSAGLKRDFFRREETSMRIAGSERLSRGQPLSWTFYLEPGVGRYLPLAGGYRQIAFTEPQIFRASSALQLVMLGREPVAMKAYRVEGMNTGDRLADGMREDFRTDGADLPLTMTDVGVSENDRAVLKKIVAEIAGEADLPPEKFAHAAMLWLAKQHTYSLKSGLPPGQGDPLVRWLTSKEPGHCELFAGAFTLLARAAGHPTRVVAGFMGGTWNDDYLMVRNSDAHAWCEISLGRGQWLRIDPTNDGPRLLAGGQQATSAVPNLRTVERGWAARLDRLRLLWYRRIVNFDRTEQQQLIHTIKASAEGTGRRIREEAARIAEALRKWLSQPWDVARFGTVVGALLFGGGVILGWQRYGRFWWARWINRHGHGLDPIRREAGNWLRRIDQESSVREVLVVRDQLERLRYGRRETWPEPGPVFREAKKASRAPRVGSARG
ncbi:MAG: DUF3488 domain-containing protein [Verrucomicrobia bacterium]|nr:DUF3488 domain-containing protein [Verrucomicrobiota bacterium]